MAASPRHPRAAGFASPGGRLATLTGGRFAVYDVSPASDNLNISIWDSPGGTTLHEVTVTGAQYTKERVGFDIYWAVIDLPDWDLDAGNYYVSMFGTNANHLGWGSTFTLGDDVQLRGNGTVASTDRYVGFQLYGDSALADGSRAVGYMGLALLGMALAGLGV